jgi:hypothetical protein
VGKGDNPVSGKRGMVGLVAPDPQTASQEAPGATIGPVSWSFPVLSTSCTVVFDHLANLEEYQRESFTAPPQ